ncbi:hypothetical protein HRbin36_01087 [bacterium HR36]|nr:hypothetical protein HRbin36_01087 [bacterium HR36]
MTKAGDRCSSHAGPATQPGWSYYWASYGLLGFCARFGYQGGALLRRGQRVWLRSHRGLELGQILWCETAPGRDVQAANGEAIGSRLTTGVILRSTDQADPWLLEHLRVLGNVQRWLDNRLSQGGVCGLICDVELIRDPQQLGILYLGLEPSTLLELGLALETEFALPSEWYDANELLAADSAWEERCQAVTEGATAQPEVSRCAGCLCSVPQGSAKNQNAGQHRPSAGCRGALPASNRERYSSMPPKPSAAHCASHRGLDDGGPAQTASCCSGCVIQRWFHRHQPGCSVRG